LPDYASLVWAEVDDIAGLIDKIDDAEFDEASLREGGRCGT